MLKRIREFFQKKSNPAPASQEVPRELEEELQKQDDETKSEDSGSEIEKKEGEEIMPNPDEKQEATAGPAQAAPPAAPAEAPAAASAPAPAAPAPAQPAPVSGEVREISAGNARPITDYVTKDDLQSILSAFEAKSASNLKQIEDLKAENDKLRMQRDGMASKYEDHDFGNAAKAGVPAGDKTAGMNFDEYMKSLNG